MWNHLRTNTNEFYCNENCGSIESQHFFIRGTSHTEEGDLYFTGTMGRKTVSTGNIWMSQPGRGYCLSTLLEVKKSFSSTYFHNSQWGRPSCHAPWQCLWTSSHFRAKTLRLHRRHTVRVYQHFPVLQSVELFLISLRRLINEGTVKGN
jgi:hypothetical protein